MDSWIGYRLGGVDCSLAPSPSLFNCDTQGHNSHIARSTTTRTEAQPPEGLTDARLGHIVRLLSDNATLVISGTRIAEELGTTRSEVWRAVQHLRELGVRIVGHPATGYQLESVADLLLPDIVGPLVSGTIFASHVRHYFRIGSTNVMALEAGAAGEPEGTVFFAEEQTAGKFVVSDFVPVPCCFPTCNSVTYAFIEGEKVTPLPRILNVYDYLDYITNRVMPDFSMEVKKALEGLWSSSSVPGSQKSTEQFAFSCHACGIPENATIGDLADHMLMIMLQDFMDPWTFNQKNLMKCCKEFLLPGGKQIPFCAYNTLGYREQARTQLEAMEPERRRARTNGTRYQPRPVTFNFTLNQLVQVEK